jgi:type IV secretory pathway VirJ component
MACYMCGCDILNSACALIAGKKQQFGNLKAQLTDMNVAVNAIIFPSIKAQHQDQNPDQITSIGSTSAAAVELSQQNTLSAAEISIEHDAAATVSIPESDVKVAIESQAVSVGSAFEREIQEQRAGVRPLPAFETFVAAATKACDLINIQLPNPSAAPFRNNPVTVTVAVPMASIESGPDLRNLDDEDDFM